MYILMCMKDPIVIDHSRFNGSFWLNHYSDPFFYPNHQWYLQIDQKVEKILKVLVGVQFQAESG